MDTRPRFGALLGAVFILLATPALVLAATGWTVDADRTSVPRDNSTPVRLTITNVGTGDKLSCVSIHIPATYDVDSAAVTSVSNGSNWSTSITGTAAHSVYATPDSNKGTDELDQGESVVVRVTVTGTVSGQSNWTVQAFSRKDCTNKISSSIGIPMTVTGAAPTPNPTPNPTPKPTPKPTPRPTNTPSPTATAAPRSTPTAQATPGSVPASSPLVSPTPAASGPTPTPTPTATAIAGGGSTTPPASGGDASKPANYFTIDLEEDSGFPVLASDILGTLGVFEWAVPSAILTVPGLLLLVVIGAQMLGAGAWLPLVRRRLGGFGISRSGPSLGS